MVRAGLLALAMYSRCGRFSLGCCLSLVPHSSIDLDRPRLTLPSLRCYGVLIVYPEREKSQYIVEAVLVCAILIKFTPVPESE